MAVELPSGVGVGWRPEIAGWVAGRTALGFCEVIVETIAPAVPPRGVAELRARGVAVVPHGVRLSLGGTDPVDAGRVTQLAACAAALDAPVVSEHIAFVRAGGLEVGHLLPVPRTREALDVLAANVRRTQTELDVPLALEPIASLFDWPDDEYSEPDFLTELLDRTGAMLLLDVHNIHANALNRGQDARAVLDRMPLDRIAYVHVAGGAERDGLYHDTHTDPMPDAVLDLLDRLVERSPAPPAVMLERDGRYPPAAELTAELDAITARLPASSPFDRPSSPDDRGPDRRSTTARAASRAVSVPESGPGRAEVVASGPSGRGPDAPKTGSPAERSDLAARQAELVAALVAGGPLPAGFDAGRLDATRHALLRKRASEAAKAWPLLAASHRPRWAQVFARNRDGHPPVGALRDGWEVARALRDLDRLTPPAAAELAGREAVLRYDGLSDPRPRRLRRAFTRLRMSR